MTFFRSLRYFCICVERSVQSFDAGGRCWSGDTSLTSWLMTSLASSFGEADVALYSAQAPQPRPLDCGLSIMVGRRLRGRSGGPSGRHKITQTVDGYDGSGGNEPIATQHSSRGRSRRTASHPRRSQSQICLSASGCYGDRPLPARRSDASPLSH